MYLQLHKDAVRNFEYGCDLRRIFPWEGVVNPLWGSAIASVRPLEGTTPHSHDEHETFLILSGEGEIRVDGDVQLIRSGDVVYLPPNSCHEVRNLADDRPLEFLTIFWGSAEANERMFAMADEMRRAQAPG